MAEIQDGPTSRFPEYPNGYTPFWVRDNGEWWNYNNTSNFWCCKDGEFNMEQWFYYDMWFLIWMMFYGEFYGDCGYNSGLPHYFTSDGVNNQPCQGTDDLKISSIPTDSGNGYTMIQGSTIANMALEINADQTNVNPPGIWMKTGFDFYINTNYAVDFYNISQSYNFFHFDFSIPTSGIYDSTIGVNSNPTGSHDSNIYLKPSQFGLVKFGEYQSCATTVIITGYITMVDSTGKVIKLAVIDYQGQQQFHGAT